MKQLQILYFIIWVIPIALSMLYWVGCINSGEYVESGSAAEYIYYSLSVFLTLAIVHLSLRCFRYRVVLKTMKDHPKAQRNYIIWNVVRLVLMLAVILLDLAVYYFFHAEAGVYAAGICLIALAFCWPNWSELGYLQSQQGSHIK